MLNLSLHAWRILTDKIHAQLECKYAERFHVSVTAYNHCTRDVGMLISKEMRWVKVLS